MKNAPQAGSAVPANNQIKSIVDRIERLEDDKDIIGESIKEVYAEAKGNGFDVKALREIIRIRKKDAGELADYEMILETYMDALGMLGGTPLGQAAINRDFSDAKTLKAIDKIEAKQAKAEKVVKVKLVPKVKRGAKPAKATGKRRGRPPGSGKKVASEPEKPAEGPRLITAQEKADRAKALADARERDTAPSKKPAAVEPITRATLAAKKAEAKDQAESYFTRQTKTDGNA